MKQGRLSLKEKLTYTIGNLGIGMITGIHIWYLVYFFFPPKDQGIPYVIPQGALILGLTLLGVIMAVGRIFDAVTDPWIASVSDNSKHKLGKRIPFLRRYAWCMAAVHVLVFVVPKPGVISPLNIIWLAGFLLLTALFVTLYTVPFYSLMVDMAKHPEDKIDVSTMNSAFWFFGFLVTSFAASMWKPIQQLFSTTTMVGIQISFAVLGLVGLVMLLIPAYTINENKYTSSEKKTQKKHKIIPSMKKVMKNKNFVYYIIANTSYTVSTYIFETGLLYFITVLARQSEGTLGLLTTIVGGATLLSYPLVNKLTKKKGKKFIIKLGFLLFALSFIDITAFGIVGVNIYVLIVILGILTPVPQAIFGILPSVMVADCAAYDKYKTGEDHSGMYVAVNGFFVKVGYSFATILFTSLLIFGKDIGNDLGIRLATIVGAVLAALSIGLISKYNEKEVMSYAENSLDENDGGMVDENC